ncbi:MAG: NAD-dependent epimerase/dehydratase family protein [Firmicutes bacterium]|nr:NAD-dependent epimerase/dehydratase family protein [Bacillota bacterium]
MILVTGAAGFIGSNLCRVLLNNGLKVLGIDSFYDNYPKWIKEFHIRHLLGNPDFIFLENNILEPGIGKLIEGLKIDCIVHLADIPGVTTCSEVNFDEYIKYNITSTQRLLEAIKNKGIKRLIYASSSTVYGNNGKLPMYEVTNTKPISLYGVTKLAGETLSNYYGHNYGMDINILRFFTTYGPNQRPDMAFHRFIKNMLLNKEISVYGDGSQKRDFVYVTDVCEIILNIIEKEIKNEVVNVGGGLTLSVEESIKIIEKLLGKSANIKYIEPISEEQLITNASIKKLSELTTIDKKTSIYDGIREEINYIKRLYGLPK